MRNYLSSAVPNCLTITKKDDEDLVNYVSPINSDFEKSDLMSISNDYFKCLVFVCGLKYTRYTDVLVRCQKLLEEKKEISLQNFGDGCVIMESILSDTTMIQNKTKEYGCVGIVAEFPHKKNIPKQ